MDLYKELVNGLGYAVCPIKDMDLFKEVRDSFVEKMNISTKPDKNFSSIRKSMAKMSKSEINATMVNFLKFNDLSEMMIKSCSNLVEELCGKELFIQRRAHATINVPGVDGFDISQHYELMSGISPFTYVLWAPLHDIDDNGGVYYMNQKNSLDMMRKEEAAGLVNGPMIFDMGKNQKPQHIKFGEVIIFNPFVLHGNTPFSSESARIACNVRFQSNNKPLLQKNSDYLKYYRLS